jgi:hypothetical protein
LSFFLIIGTFSIPLDLSKVPAINQFVGRDQDLGNLWNLLQPSASAMKKVVVLHGLGGIGKTQLAIRFARVHQHDYSAIFWLDGKNREMLIRSLAEFLPKLPGVNVVADPKTKEEIEQAARQVLQWLANPDNSKWLLIFDHIDKYLAAKQSDSEAYDVARFFPPTDHGSIIITSRVLQLSELGQSYPVYKFQSQDATTLLINSAGLATAENRSSIYQGQ